MSTFSQFIGGCSIRPPRYLEFVANAGSPYTWTVPSNITQVYVGVMGAGGGGGGSNTTTDRAVGGGGGGWAESYALSVVPSETITITIGAGGAGGANANGAGGGTSSIAAGTSGWTITATGGAGGTKGAGSQTGATGGAGSSGDLNSTGGASGDATANGAATGGGGPGNPYGTGAASGNVSAASASGGAGVLGPSGAVTAATLASGGGGVKFGSGSVNTTSSAGGGGMGPSSANGIVGGAGAIFGWNTTDGFTLTNPQNVPAIGGSSPLVYIALSAVGPGNSAGGNTNFAMPGGGGMGVVGTNIPNGSLGAGGGCRECQWRGERRMGRWRWGRCCCECRAVWSGRCGKGEHCRKRR